MSRCRLASIGLAGLVVSWAFGVAAKEAKTDARPGRSEKTVAEALSGLKDEKTFASGMAAAGLSQKLGEAGPFTVFAPSDVAFRKLPPGAVENLLKPENKPQLQAVMTYHIVAGALTARDLQAKITQAGGKAELMTLQGETLTAQKKGRVIELLDAKGDVAALGPASLTQSNGIIHGVDTVLLP